MPERASTLALNEIEPARAFDWVVGLSGGRDSVALLHALRHAAQTESKGRAVALRAVHIHHGLSPHADHWAEFCETLCTRWGVPLRVIRVAVEIRPRVSVEAQARTVRYAALRDACAHSEIVALAHHADDQIESFWLQLLRGAGPRGLAAMPTISTASENRPALWRPLLTTLRSEIDAYATAHGLTHIEDESNANTRFKRNALRADVMPMIERHFPAYRRAMLRAVAHQQAVVETLDAQTERAAVHSPLALALLREGTSGEAAELLRRWLQTNALPLPPATRTREAVRQLRALSTDQRFRLLLSAQWELAVKKSHLVAREREEEI